MNNKIIKNEETFVIKILDRQNSTWQGNILWVDQQNEQYFRSALEMLKLIDGALDMRENLKEGGSDHEK
ncbi:MAG: hypothetical protein PUH88_10015 [Lachnospiraceae bacterium]|nr:hypothetical protein [Lachnospiraceae bacterium]